MQLRLNINDDEKFKKEIKLLVESQIKSVVRAELESIVRTYFEQQTKNGNTRFYDVFRYLLRELIDNHLKQSYSYPNSLKDFCQLIIKEELNNILATNKFTVTSKTLEIVPEDNSK